MATWGGDPDSVLDARARQYAQAPAAQAGTWAEVLLVRIGEEQYALELRWLRSVHDADGLAQVPCTPAYVAGILNVRGEVVTVLDLAVILGLGAGSESDRRSHVLLSELPQGRIGLLVDEVLGAEQVELDGLSRGLSGRDFVRGVADARIVLLDVEQLFRGERLDVYEEVS
jgi:purine-binding chemotaxis protein CheW